MRIVVMMSTYNEERFIAACLEHYLRHEIEVYLIDNESTDATLEIAREYCDRNLINIESFPRTNGFDLKALLLRKEELARTLKADWFMHADLDEIRIPPTPGTTLCQALREVDRQGFNAVNFFEFVFTPTWEEPDHDHRDYLKSMQWYYPFSPWYPHHVNTWKQPRPPLYQGMKHLVRKITGRKPVPPAIDLAFSGGHAIKFEAMNLYPVDFKMRHYLYLSREHAIEKYCQRDHPPESIQRGWHGWRATITPEQICLPTKSQLRHYTNDDELDPSNPLTDHLIRDSRTVSKDH